MSEATYIPADDGHYYADPVLWIDECTAFVTFSGDEPPELVIKGEATVEEAIDVLTKLGLSFTRPVPTKTSALRLFPPKWHDLDFHEATAFYFGLLSDIPAAAIRVSVSKIPKDLFGKAGVVH